ncbi:unnamed protein product [Phyllotreta striolata]|uniref:Uncharacterized protein n=1 Tax=Phyllotreta striolata TaxID=444603 RepID=A0A9N9TFQ6_PHYSR|nr:unnamed protein product [Phyllotreta striolata]
MGPVRIVFDFGVCTFTAPVKSPCPAPPSVTGYPFTEKVMGSVSNALVH